MAEIINPLTPLAYLPPDLAVQFEASRYLYVATFGAFLWDWITAAPEEWRLVKKANRILPIFTYFLSRFSALAYIVTSVVFQVSPVADCQALELINTIFYCFAVSSASFLFYIRVHAVFHTNTMIQVVFGFLWLGVLGASVTVPLAVKGIHIGPTKYCVNAEVKSFSSAAVIMSTLNDSLVFLAISLRLVAYNQVDSRTKALVKGQGLSSISKALFKGGQIYYLTTVCMNALTLVFVLAPSAPPVYRAMFTIPNNALQNVMACKVFRQLRLGIIANTDLPTISRSGTEIALSWRHTHQHTTVASFQSPELPDHQHSVQKQHANPDDFVDNRYMVDIKVEVTRDTEIV